MSVLYHCPHLDESRRPPLPSSYPSSSTSFTPLHSLYFCEECDGVRCNQCVAVEVASYYCPNCLFDVPSANVRGDRNKCNRSCYACPQCATALQIQPTEKMENDQMISGAPYSLICTGCRWSSKTIGWEFDKATGIASQLAKLDPGQAAKTEFEAIKDHLETYMSSSNPEPIRTSSKVPTRHISHLTQMAAKALHRDVPGLAAAKAKGKVRATAGSRSGGLEKAHTKWDELSDYVAKDAWRGGNDSLGIDQLSEMERPEVAALSKRWCSSWGRSSLSSSVLPDRILLHTKLTKRCPHPSCRHLLIQPDAKSVRFKIKMVALNYLPAVEIGRRRRRQDKGPGSTPMAPEEIEQRQRERRRTKAKAGDEEDEEMDKALERGAVYVYQLAFTNPLYDPIQIRLTQPYPPKDAPPINHHVHIPTQHFTVSALKEAWAYDEDDEDDDLPGLEGASEVPSDEGVSTVGGTLGRRNRISTLGTTSSGLREKRARGETGVEKKANMTKVLLEVEVLPDAKGDVTFDLEVRYTYRADAPAPNKEEPTSKSSPNDELKTFTFWVRLNVGKVA
ncbi:dynactin subunit 4 [Kockovaella imperatae]|uniref:Dynactin subunit 4 n=1 Tax=Kockovaella imperatae TaxID=4999 RepID=A0A1Y1UE49_9TREE|nr:dynactin subunit 4 [Kockovaella imperatae]ORX36318.1 dynactin subunit 4 [Kockovaella imperatae]